MYIAQHMKNDMESFWNVQMRKCLYVRIFFFGKIGHGNWSSYLEIDNLVVSLVFFEIGIIYQIRFQLLKINHFFLNKREKYLYMVFLLISTKRKHKIGRNHLTHLNFN